MPLYTATGSEVYNQTFPWYITTASTDSTTTRWRYWPFQTSTTTGTNYRTYYMVNTWPFNAQLTTPWQPNAVPVRTVEEQQLVDEANEAAQREWQRWEDQERARSEQIRVAASKAEELLLSILDAQQREDRAAKGHFEVVAKSGRRYRIYRNTHGNVFELSPAGKETHRLCVQPDDVPEGDAHVAQKLMIEADEEGFRRTANIRRVA